MPFRLAYETDAVILAKVGLTSYRVENYSEGKNEEALCLQLDLVDEFWGIAEQRLTRYQNLMAKHYNSNVRHRDFQVGDLVLRKVMGVAKDPSQGKLGRIGKDYTGSRHGRGRAPTTLRRWMDGNFNTNGAWSTFGNTTSRDNGRWFSPISQLT